MNPILYSSTETSFTTNGLGRLSDAISCVITEERNGIFELEMEYPITGTHYSDIKEERILFAQPRPGGANQAFRIYKISRPISGRVMVSARHISYQLNKITVKPFQASSCVGAISGLKTNSIGSNPFEFWTDKNALATFTVDTPSTARSLLGGQTGSILDTFGTGEYEWDMYTVKLHQSRGHNNGVTLRYGKNITDLNNTADTGSVYTGIVPFWKGTDTVVILPELVLYGSHRSEYPYDMVIPVDLSSRWQDAPTVEQLRSAANSYLNSSTGWQINTNLKVSFVNLSDTEEYKKIATLQRVNLCDTVTVIHEKLGVEATAKVIKTVFNVLTERYDSIELGNSRTSLSESITETIMEEVPTSSDMERAIANGTKLITGGLGGYVYLKPNATGQPEEILIMDNPDYTQATKLWRLNKNGIAYSNTGYNGTYKQAWTMDGAFYTDWVTAGIISANLVKTGKITGQSAGSTMEIDIDGGTISCGDKELKVNATNFKLKANGDLELKGKVTATSGKIGAFTLTDALYYGNKTAFDKVGENGGYIGIEGIAFGATEGNEHSLFEIDADGRAYSQFMYYLNKDGRPTRYSWHNMYGYYGNYNDIIATSGAIDVNIENYGTTRLWNNNQIDGYQKISSDRRLKKDIRYLSQQESADVVLKLKPAEFRFKDTDRYWRGLRHGFIAQDLVEIVGDDEENSPFIEIQDWDGMYGIRYQELIADVVNVVQMQQARIDELENRLAYVESLLEGDGK